MMQIKITSLQIRLLFIISLLLFMGYTTVSPAETSNPEPKIEPNLNLNTNTTTVTTTTTKTTKTKTTTKTTDAFKIESFDDFQTTLEKNWLIILVIVFVIVVSVIAFRKGL